MEHPVIQFKKTRDFGQVLNDTFEFLKYEYKKLGLALVYFVLPFIIVGIALFSWIFADIFKFQLNNPTQIYSVLMLMFSKGFFVMVVFVVGYIMSIATTYSYMKLYEEKGPEGFSMQDLWNKLKTKFWLLLGASIVSGIIIFLGFILCFFPGFYLWISLSLFSFIIVYEDADFGTAFSRSFDLTKIQWWWTLLITLVASMIPGFLTSVLLIPQYIMTFSAAFNDTSMSSGTVESMAMTTIIFTAIRMILLAILNVIPLIAIAFQYFNLREIKERPSLEDKINAVN